jgi:hypothetical protein
MKLNNLKRLNFRLSDTHRFSYPQEVGSVIFVECRAKLRCSCYEENKTWTFLIAATSVRARERVEASASGVSPIAGNTTHCDPIMALLYVFILVNFQSVAPIRL